MTKPTDSEQPKKSLRERVRENLDQALKSQTRTSVLKEATINTLVSLVFTLMGVIVSLAVNLLSERVLFEVPQQILNLVVTIISSAAFLGLLITGIVLYRKRRLQQEKISIERIRHDHVNLFDLVERNAMTLIQGKSE